MSFFCRWGGVSQGLGWERIGMKAKKIERGGMIKGRTAK